MRVLSQINKCQQKKNKNKKGGMGAWLNLYINHFISNNSKWNFIILLNFQHQIFCRGLGEIFCFMMKTNESGNFLIRQDLSENHPAVREFPGFNHHQQHHHHSDHHQHYYKRKSMVTCW